MVFKVFWDIILEVFVCFFDCRIFLEVEFVNVFLFLGFNLRVMVIFIVKVVSGFMI